MTANTAAAARARVARSNSWLCDAGCGAEAVSVGAFPHGWVQLAQRGGPPTRYACSWLCALRLVRHRLVAAVERPAAPAQPVGLFDGERAG